jgi:hypothetical protein
LHSLNLTFPGLIKLGIANYLDVSALIDPNRQNNAHASADDGGRNDEDESSHDGADLLGGGDDDLLPTANGGNANAEMIQKILQCQNSAASLGEEDRCADPDVVTEWHRPNICQGN